MNTQKVHITDENLLAKGPAVSDLIPDVLFGNRAMGSLGKNIFTRVGLCIVVPIFITIGFAAHGRLGGANSQFRTSGDKVFVRWAPPEPQPVEASLKPIHWPKPVTHRPRPAKVATKPKISMRQLFNAIRLVESRGNDWAVGDRGTARGPYQITRNYWRDACRAGRLRIEYYSEVWNRRQSERIMLCYWQKYCPQALAEFRRNGTKSSAEVLARIHNGGPTGMAKYATIKYWKRVQRRLGKAN